MLDDREFKEEMDRVVAAYAQRTEAISKAQEDFIDAVVNAYENGLTIKDICHATGVAVGTIRGKLSSRGVVIRLSRLNR